MQRLYPTPSAELSDADLEELYAFPPDRTWVRANFVSSLDGAAQGTDFKSGTLSSKADERVFALQRALCELVLAGAGTTRVEGYKPVQPGETSTAVRARHGLDPYPVIAVVSRSLKLDPELVRGGQSPTIVVTTESAPADRRLALSEIAPVIVAGADNVDLGRAVDELARMGYRRILCEGGPSLMRELVASGRLDDLCLTISPLLTAGDKLRILNGPGLDPPPRLTLRHLLEENGDVFARYSTS